MKADKKAVSPEIKAKLIVELKRHRAALASLGLKNDDSLLKDIREHLKMPMSKE